MKFLLMFLAFALSGISQEPILIQKGLADPFNLRNRAALNSDLRRTGVKLQMQCAPAMRGRLVDFDQPLSIVPEKQAASVAVTLQPKEVFEAAFSELISGVALFDLLVCNNTDSGMKINGGKAMQAIHPRVEPISARLYALTALRGKKKNWKYKTMRVAEWSAFGATMLFTSGAVAVTSDLLRVLPPLVMDGSRRLAKEWEGAGLDPALLTTQFLTSDTDVILDAQQCRSYPLLGRYRGQMKPFEVPIQ